MTVTARDLQAQFKSELASVPGGETVRFCYDCGTCTGACPVSESGTGFDPRKILHMIKLGLKDQLLRSPALWHCTHCETCGFVCPQGVRFSTVVDALREMAVEQGYDDGQGVEKWGAAPCKAACPAHISIPGFVGAVAEGRFEEGLKLIKEEMPFPGICGRICPHPCETDCNRGGFDKPVAIEYLKRFLADADQSRERGYVPERKADKKGRVAVIGAGPAGLTAAYYLAIEGYAPTVFEKLPLAGGMMAVGIPEFRLPRNVLEAEIDVIRSLGVDIRLNVEIGKDLAFSDLKKDYDAVFIGVGCHRSLKLGIPGEDEWSGVIDGITFLREINLGRMPEPESRLVIIGGGNTAVDCARVARRAGYESVAMLYRRTREEMPASPWEVEDTIEEEIDVQYLTAPVRVLGKEGRVTGLECIRMKLGKPDESGRRRPVPVKGSEFTVPANVVVTALGQATDLTFIPDHMGIHVTNKGLIRVEPQTGTTSVPGIFAGGDAAHGPRTVVEAVAIGKEAAAAIDAYLQGGDRDADRKPSWKGIAYRPEDAATMERVPMPRIALLERKGTFKEVDQGYNEEQARCEAGRCFRICGVQRI